MILISLVFEHEWQNKNKRFDENCAFEYQVMLFGWRARILVGFVDRED